MSDNFIRHLVSVAITIIVGLAWLSGYFSGIHNWWWTSFGIIAIYALTYKLIDV